MHQLDLLDEEFRSLPLLDILIHFLFLLQDERIEVFTGRVRVFYLSCHHDLHLRPNLFLVLLVVVLSVELIDVWKFTVLRDRSNHFVGEVKKFVDFSDPEAFFMEELEFHPVKTEVVKHVAISEHIIYLHVITLIIEHATDLSILIRSKFHLAVLI